MGFQVSDWLTGFWCQDDDDDDDEDDNDHVVLHLWHNDSEIICILIFITALLFHMFFLIYIYDWLID